MSTTANPSRRMALIAAGAVMALGSFAGASAWAETGYPNKPIRLIVPFPPGGGTDLVARTVAQKLTETLKWTVIIDNRPGAGGNLGVDLAAKSPADGYTLVLGQTSNLAINPTLYSNLPYKPLKDLTPIVLVSNSPIVICAPESSPFKTFADVVAAARAKPGAVTLGYPGNGTVAHLSSELAEKAAGIKLQHVPYKGASQALTDLISAQIDLYASSVPTLIGQVRNHKVRPLAVTSARRSEQLPDVPTLAESGYPGFDAVTWFGILAPAGTPADIVKTLNTEINRAMQAPDVIAKLKSDGGDVMGGSAETFAALLKTDTPRWGKIVKESGATID